MVMDFQSVVFDGLRELMSEASWTEDLENKGSKEEFRLTKSCLSTEITHLGI